MERFWSKVHVGALNDCWEWQAYRNKDGYGMFKIDGKPERSHRVAAMLSGIKTEGRIIMHRCDNPPCCNPLHLSDGTAMDNWDDMRAKGRNRGAPRATNFNTKLTDSQVEEICTRYVAGGVSQQALADEYGVTQVRVSQLVRNGDF